MKLKIPPVLQFMIFTLIMYGITRISSENFTFSRQNLISYIFFFIGILINLSALYSFAKAKTTANPLNPSKASQLVILGIYKYSRNPMYLGMLFGLTGIFILFGNYFNSLVLLLFIGYITNFQIKPEERALTTIFGNAFTTYCKNVRRWI